jgi:hypothetical protein
MVEDGGTVLGKDGVGLSRELVPPDPGKFASQSLQSQQSTNNLTTAAGATGTPVSGAGGSKMMIEEKSYMQAMEEMKMRNVMEISIREGSPKGTTLSEATFGNFILKYLKVPREMCLQYNYATFGVPGKELLLKPEYDFSDLVGPYDYEGLELSVAKKGVVGTTVTFRQVPLYVPDIELLNIVKHYGKLAGTGPGYIEYEAGSSELDGLPNSNTRRIKMSIDPARDMPNYFWLEGTGPSGMSRITATYNGQQPQCHHCLQMRDECPHDGRGKKCKEGGVPRGNASKYMKMLATDHGFYTRKAKEFSAYPWLGAGQPRQAVVPPVLRTTGEDKEEAEDKEDDKERSALAEMLHAALKCAMPDLRQVMVGSAAEWYAGVLLEYDEGEPDVEVVIPEDLQSALTEQLMGLDQGRDKRVVDQAVERAMGVIRDSTPRASPRRKKSRVSREAKEALRPKKPAAPAVRLPRAGGKGANPDGAKHKDEEEEAKETEDEEVKTSDDAPDAPGREEGALDGPGLDGGDMEVNSEEKGGIEDKVDGGPAGLGADDKRVNDEEKVAPKGGGHTDKVPTELESALTDPPFDLTPTAARPPPSPPSNGGRGPHFTDWLFKSMRPVPS